MAHYCQFIYTHLSKSVGREGQITTNGSIMERSCNHQLFYIWTKENLIDGPSPSRQREMMIFTLMPGIKNSQGCGRKRRSSSLTLLVGHFQHNLSREKQHKWSSSALRKLESSGKKKKKITSCSVMMLKSQDRDPLIFLSYNFIFPKQYPSIQQNIFCECFYLQTRGKMSVFGDIIHHSNNTIYYHHLSINVYTHIYIFKYIFKYK